MTSVSNPILGKADGMFIKDSFCLSSNIEGCYQNNTENFYEFFLIKNSSTPDMLLGAGIADGFIGLAPGQNGMKSYPEYLKARKIINSNTIGITVNDKKTQGLVSLGANKPANATGVNYVLKTMTSVNESVSLYLSSFQGLSINGSHYETANTSKSYLQIEYLQNGLMHISSNNTKATLNAFNLFNKTLANLSTPANFKLYNVSQPNKTSWVSIASFMHQDSCAAIIKKFNTEVRIDIGGNKIIGLNTTQDFFYNAQTKECLFGLYIGF